MTDKKTCFFIGSRHSSDDIREELKEVIRQHITEYAVTEFVVGHYGGFDRLVISVLRELKQEYNHITACLLIPYHPTIQPIETPKGLDGTLYLDGMETVPKRLAIIKANTMMIDKSDYLIAHRGVGNSRNLIEYALKREKRGLIKVTLI